MKPFTVTKIEFNTPYFDGIWTVSKPLKLNIPSRFEHAVAVMLGKAFAVKFEEVDNEAA